MMEPSRLPAELFTMVIDYATDGRNDFRVFYNFSLVSRQWYAALNARIYSKWFYDGERHSISSLWKFLRSVLCSKQIADSVHELNIRNWTFGLVHERGRLILSEADLDLVRNAIRTVGLQRIEPSILVALQKADPRPLMALLLASLRNLTMLYAHLPETDIFFTEVLRKAVESRRDQIQNDYPPLHALREAHFTSAWNYREEEEVTVIVDAYKLKLDHLWPVFQLPNIQRLSVFDFESHGASNRFENGFKTSSITDLTIVHHIDSLPAVPDALALLTLPKKLTKLSIYLTDCDFFGNSQQLSNADLWNGIQQYEDSIEYLDIYRDCTLCIALQHSANNLHFGTMRGFKRLECLCIQPEVLLGACCEDDLALYSLRDTLPPTLKSLTFYGDEGMALNKTLGPQLQDVITSIDFPCLVHVALEMRFEYIHYYIDSVYSPCDEVEQACRERGIQYETKHASSCTKGSIACRYYQHVREKRLQNKNLETIRLALTIYLDRLRESTYRDGGSPDDRPELSSDDLDTYELPWDELTEFKVEFEDEDPYSEDEDWGEFDTEDTNS